MSFKNLGEIKSNWIITHYCIIRNEQNCEILYYAQDLRYIFALLNAVIHIGHSIEIEGVIEDNENGHTEQIILIVIMLF